MRARRSRAAALLEAVVGLAVLATGMAAVGIQIHTALSGAIVTDRMTRAVMLAESKLAELDAGLLRLEMELAAEFGPAFPGFAWQMTIEPTDTPDLNLVTIEISHGPSDPETGEIIGEPEVLYTVRTFRATPATVDMQRDFGFTAEQMDTLSGGMSTEGFDLSEFNPQSLQSLDLEELLDMLPTLIEMFGGGQGLDPEAIREAIESGGFSARGASGEAGGKPEEAEGGEEPR